MSPRLQVLGDAESLALAGLPPEGVGLPAGAPDVVVSLGSREPSDPGVVSVEWSDRPARGDDGIRLIAPGGEGLWQTCPWPVADAVFDLPSSDSGEALIAGGRQEEQEDLVRLLADLGVTARTAKRLTLEDLRVATVVILPAGPHEPLPGRAFAAPAARRVLVTGRCRPAFGLRAGIDYLPAAPADEAARVAAAVLRFPRAFEGLRAWGRLAAERHRASRAYRRVLVDIALEEGWSPALSGDRGVP
jgi:hypothetical protein